MTPPTPRPRPIPLPVVPVQPWSSVHGGLPSPRTPGIQLHELLRPSSPPRMYYDVGKPPSTIIFDSRYTPLTLAMPATTPPLTSFRIMLPTAPPMPVAVYNARGVTVFDVLNALYHSLRAPAGQAAGQRSVWDELDYPHIVTPPLAPFRAHSYNPPRTPRLSGEEGRRKIDYLHGRTKFAGLEQGVMGHGTWDLRTTE